MNPQTPKCDGIPTYAADGRRLRNSSEQTILRLLELDKVIVARNRRGIITCAHYRPVGGANPLRRAAHAGTKYYRRERVAGEHHIFQHRHLLQSQEVEQLMGEPVESEADLDLFLKAIFRAVPLSVMRQQPPSRKVPATAAPRQQKVVSIDAGRRKFTHRPIEFDSEGRIAA